MTRKLFFALTVLAAFTMTAILIGDSVPAEELPVVSVSVPALPSQVQPKTPVPPSLPDVTRPGLPQPSLPTFSKLTFPQRSFPTPPITPITPGVSTPVGLTTPPPVVEIIPEFEWLSWWNINVSYQLKMRDEGLFYREVQVEAADVPQILSLLDYSGVFYPMTRNIAVQCLEKLDQTGIDALRTIASGKWDGKGKVHPMISDRKLQGLAAFALGLLRSRESLSVVLDLSKDPRPDVRMLAVLGLGHIGAEEGEARLLEMLPNERDNRVASAIMMGLSQIGSEKSRKVLLEAAESSRSNPVRQAMAFLSLSLLINKPSVADINRAAFSADPAQWLSGVVAKAALMMEKKPEAREVDRLISLALLHTDKISTLTAILPLHLLGENLGVSDLKPLLTHADANIRAMARFLAALSGSPELTASVVDKVADDDPEASYLQSLALAYLAAPDRARFASQLLNEKNLVARIAGVLAMGDYMERADTAKLRSIIVSNDEPLELKLATLLAFSRASSYETNAWNEMVRNLRNRDRMIQDLAMVLIGSTRSLRAAKLLLELRGAEIDELPFSIALSLLGPLPYELTLRQALETKGEIPRSSAVLAYSFLPLESSWAHLFEVLDSDSMGLARAHAAFGLSNHKARPISNTQAKILVEAAEKGPDIWVRGYSALALGRYSQNKDVAATLEQMMDNPNINIKAMAALGAGINKYPKGVQILKELIEKEKSYAVFAQIISLGMFQHRMFVPYFGDGIKFSSSDHERLAFAAALSSSLEPGDYPEILEKLANANSVDRKTYAWTLALHDYPGMFLARKVVDALKQAKPDNDDVTRFHLALARCSLGDGVAAKELIEAAASKGFSYHQILPEPRFLLEYFQSELPDYGHILPYFHLD